MTFARTVDQARVLGIRNGPALVLVTAPVRYSRDRLSDSFPLGCTVRRTVTRPVRAGQRVFDRWASLGWVCGCSQNSQNSQFSQAAQLRSEGGGGASENRKE